MAVTKNTVWYTNFGNGTSTGYYAVAMWTASTAYTVGQLARQRTTPTVGNERVFVCIVAGTSSASEATWVVTKGAKTTEASGVVWMECTGQPAVNGDQVNTPLSSANRSGAQVLGSIIQNTTGTFYFICSVAGTTGASDPSFVFTVGSTTVDSGCTWTCISAVGGYGAWVAPFARLSLASTWTAAADTIYVSSAHTETTLATSTTIALGTTSLITMIVCVSNTSYNPPLSSDLATGASISNTQPLTFNGSFYMSGMTIGTGGATFNLGTNASPYIRLQNCTLSVAGSSTNLGSVGSYIELDNVNIASGSTSLGVVFAGPLVWRGGALTGTAPNAVNGFNVSNTGVCRVLIEGVDLSNFTNGPTFASETSAGFCMLSGCKISTQPVLTTNTTSPRAATIDVINCDSGTQTFRHERWWNEGVQVCDLSAVHTSGASDGTTPLSWKVTTSAMASWNDPFECMPITIWNAVTGANVNVTLQCAYSGAALPFNDGIWMDARHYGSATSPLLSTVTGTKANYLTTHTQYSASTAAWDSIASTRANNNAYSVGNYFRLSSNPGQLFLCLTAGTSASSQPVAYTSVADGVSVTDGTAVFRALVRFAMTVTLSSPQPQIAGYIRCYVRAALPSSTWWIDPLITLS